MIEAVFETWVAPELEVVDEVVVDDVVVEVLVFAVVVVVSVVVPSIDGYQIVEPSSILRSSARGQMPAAERSTARIHKTLKNRARHAYE